MRKILLFAVAFGFAFTGFAQNQSIVNKHVKSSKDIVDNGIQNNLPIPTFDVSKAVNEDINRIYAGKATDFRTVRKEDTRTISYNKELDIISITFTLDPVTYGTDATDIGIIYSTDRGQTWSEPVVVVDNGNSFINDYPSNIVFNPAGNTNIENAYGIVQNISHVGGDWGYKMWASMTLGGANQDITVSHNPDNIEDGYWNQFGLTQSGNNIHCLSMLPQGDWGSYQSAEMQPIIGEFNSTSFDWDESTLIEMDLYQNSDDGQMAWIGSYQGHDGGLDMAWSNDGQIGYMWMIGTNTDEPSGYRPLVFRSEDAGDSWDFVEIDFLTDEMQTFLDPYIIENWVGDMIPSFVESCGVVDYHGDLQMAFVATSHSADVLNYPDSLGWGWAYPGDLFNMTVDAGGIQDIIWVDSLNTQNVVDDDEGNYAGNGWQHRITMAKNDFANEIFLTWIDTEVPDEAGKNINPDIYGWSRNIHINENSESTCFTCGTLYEKFYFFTYGAEWAIWDEETETYTIPYFQAVSPNEISTNGAGDPITLNYVTGIEFPAIGEYVGVHNGIEAVSFSVSQNTPNPFNGNSKITVNTPQKAVVMIEVTNLMGQQIYTENAGTISGQKEIEIHAENLEAGVYFYTVTIANESITKKMIIE